MPAFAPATSTIVSSLGAGSGIEMAALATNLAAAQFAAKTDRLTVRSETLQRQISSASSLRSMLASLASSLGERVHSGDLSPQPSLANSGVARAALAGTRAPSGSYALEVTALAAAQTLTGPAYATATAVIGGGTLTLRFGTIASAGFTEDAAHPAKSIAIPSGATLTEVASAINSSNAGVAAYVANTVNGAKLVLKGQAGAANAGAPTQL